MENILIKQLFELKDDAYKEFHSKLIPDVDKNKIIGIRTPALRKFAKDYSKTPESKLFISELPHKYYEENNLHAFIIESVNDITDALKLTESFLPYIDNWATCDMFFPAVFKKHPEIMEKKAFEWIASKKTYVIRYGIGIFMKMFLGDNYNKKYPEAISKIKSVDYYVNMMIAWYFATGLTKRYNDIISFFEKPVLDKWTHNKAIQKARESLCVPKEVKAYLNTLKVK